MQSLCYVSQWQRLPTPLLAQRPSTVFSCNTLSSPLCQGNSTVVTCNCLALNSTHLFPNGLEWCCQCSWPHSLPDITSTGNPSQKQKVNWITWSCSADKLQCTFQGSVAKNNKQVSNSFWHGYTDSKANGPFCQILLPSYQFTDFLPLHIMLLYNLIIGKGCFWEETPSSQNRLLLRQPFCDQLEMKMLLRIMSNQMTFLGFTEES